MTKRCDPATTPVARERRPREGMPTKRGNAHQEKKRISELKTGIEAIHSVRRQSDSSPT
ncbi:MAG: hypothetical protein F6K23_37985 [Okeania sp. SIO2C9]|uniref:hypothetical protein n=1 Tax=Okeania sp. SIO2C9 TaxID=2607791 RepID=UPI0013C23E1C|nr:hypothetical protein [Okeania sp. SIO2C9]NEQ78276.1 hypothetical protein [Okeania sp. SIO2C9]